VQRNSHPRCAPYDKMPVLTAASLPGPRFMQMIVSVLEMNMCSSLSMPLTSVWAVLG